jgi:hypothetical protein
VNSPTDVGRQIALPVAYASRIAAWSGRHPSSGHASAIGIPIGGSSKLRLDQLSLTAVRTNPGPRKYAYSGSPNGNPRTVPLDCADPEHRGSSVAAGTLPPGAVMVRVPCDTYGGTGRLR